MTTGVVPTNSYRVLLDLNGEIVWETEKDSQTLRYRNEPEPPSSGARLQTC